MATTGRLYSTTRQVTGPAYHHGYIYRDNRAVWSCSHKHRSAGTAQRCANLEIIKPGRMADLKQLAHKPRR